MSDEKTEEPTEKKLDAARKKGQSPKSQDVNTAAGLLATTLCLSGAASLSTRHLERLIALATGAGIQVRDDAHLRELAFAIAAEGGWIVLPVIAAAIAAGLIASFGQVGVNITFEPLTPNFDKLNPASGLKKLFSMRSLIELAKSVLKALLVGSVIVIIGLGLVPLLVASGTQTPLAIAAIGWAAVLKLMGAATLVFLVIGPADLGLQRWLFVRDQRMSKDEVKREHKDAEGDPQLKGKRRELARESANEAPQTRVPGATVVVTNPTHYAVALYYRQGETALPVVVAKGADEQAARIRAIAEASGVPLVGNPPLARALFKVPVDDPVPEALFESVAAVLRWVATLERLMPDVAPPSGGNGPV